MINLDDFIRTRGNDELSALLIKELRKVTGCNDEFVLCVLACMKTDSERKEMIEYLQKGEDITYGQVLLNAIDITPMDED